MYVECPPSRVNEASASPSDDAHWPADVRMVLSAMDASQPTEEQRRTPRQRYRARAELELFVDAPGSAPWPLFIRDVCDRSLGFVTRHRLPLGYGGVLRVPAPDGKLIRVECVLLRCRETVSGWYEGAIYFNRRQWVFESIVRA